MLIRTLFSTLRRLRPARQLARRRTQDRSIANVGCEQLEDRKLLTAGDLYLAFGEDGYARTDFQQGDDDLRDTAVHADGHIVSVGSSIAPGQFHMAISVRTSAGNPMNSFSGNGKGYVDFGMPSQAHAVAFHGDDMIVVGSATSELSYDFAMTRVLPNGSPDPTFGTDGTGRVVFQDDFIEQARDVAVDSDGRIIVLVSTVADYNSSQLMRFHPDGTLDESFGEDGYSETVEGYGNTLAIDSAGRYVIGGSDLQSSYLLIWFYQSGTRVPYDHTNTDSMPIQPGAVITDIAIDSSGRTLAVGEIDGDFGIVRLNHNLEPDLSFLSDGYMTDSGLTPGNTASLAFDDNGRIMATSNEGVLRYETDGALDTYFGDDGLANVMPGDTIATDIDVSPGGRIYVSATHDSLVSDTNDFLVAEIQEGTPYGGAGGYTVPGPVVPPPARRWQFATSATTKSWP